MSQATRDGSSTTPRRPSRAKAADAATFHVAAEGRDHGLSAATTLECLAESWNNAKASPPWGLDDLERKVRNAFQYAQGRAGSRTPEAMFPDPVPGGADPPPARRGLRLLHGWEALPTGEASWLADGLIPADGTTLLFGESGAGKSFVALDLAHCIASGQPFHGHSVQQGSVVYVVGEGLHGLWARSRAWCRVHSVTEKLPLFFADAPVAMNAAAQVAELRTAIQGVEAEHGPVVALFVDTLSQNFGGGDENDATSVQAFLRGADEAMQFRRARIIIHHNRTPGPGPRPRQFCAARGLGRILPGPAHRGGFRRGLRWPHFGVQENARRPTPCNPGVPGPPRGPGGRYRILGA